MEAHVMNTLRNNVRGNVSVLDAKMQQVYIFA